MGAFLFYLIKSGFCLVLLYLFFRFVMSRTTFFRLNRLTLIVGMGCCAILPLMELTTEEPFAYNPLQPIRFLLEGTYSSTSVSRINESGDDAAQWNESLAETNESKEVSRLIPTAITSIYLFGAFAVFLWISVSTFRMWMFIHKAEVQKIGRYKLIITSQPISSFSWGRYIVLSETDHLRYAEEIMRHEMMHLRNHHTLDLLFFQLFLILHWFNPVVWLLKRELQEIHEYEADEGVINTGIDATRYQLLLVKKAVGTRLYSMANGFNHSKLKNRITMMLKERTNRWARLKLLLYVPVVAGTLYAFAQPEVKEVLQQEKPEMRQEKADDYVSLMKFFKKEEGAYYDRIFGKKEPRDIIVKERQVHQLLVNTKNVILFDNEYQPLDGLKAAVIKNLMKSWEASKRKDVPIVNVVYDRGADISVITKILGEVKSAYDEIRTNLAATSTDKSKEYLDKLVPYMVVEGEPKNYGMKVLPKEEKIKGIVVTLQTPEGTDKMENFTLDELEQRVIAARGKMTDPDNFVVGLKIDKDSKMGPVADVKNVLRKVYATKVTMN